jgi:lysozyme
VTKNVKIPLTQNQFDALVSHTWNTGGSDTLFELINRKSGEKYIRDWFETKYITANGKMLKGLVSRRKEEANLYFTI